MRAFAFSTTPIDTAAGRAALADPACGGYATFEGWVRNHNEGRAVLRLEYEAFAALAEHGIDAVVYDREASRSARPQGGALALGHPWGASGAVLVVRLFSQLVTRRQGRLGLAAICLLLFPVAQVFFFGETDYRRAAEQL